MVSNIYTLYKLNIFTYIFETKIIIHFIYTFVSELFIIKNGRKKVTNILKRKKKVLDAGKHDSPAGIQFSPILFSLKHFHYLTKKITFSLKQNYFIPLK